MVDVAREAVESLQKAKFEENTKEEKELLRKGLNTSGKMALYNYFRRYINYPSFKSYVDGKSKYKEMQFEMINKLLFSTNEIKQIVNNIKDTIKYLQSEGFEEYTWEKFEIYSLLCFKKEQDKKKLQKNKVVVNNNGYLKIDNYLDNVKELWKIKPFFYDKAKLFWFWDEDKCCWEMVDETDVLINIDEKLGLMGQLVTGKVRSNYLEAFKQLGRKKIPKDNPKHWIQFKDKVWDLKEKKIFQGTPEFFLTNPIPWNIGASINTPTMDKLFIEWVGEEYKETLYEILAYCCLPDYPIHLMFCLVGGGRNGKSQFQKIISKFMGMENVCSTELDLLIDNRFESTKLHKKLVCTLGETNFGMMKKTSLLKKLSGGDLIGFEFKNKQPFDDYNYAKIIINSNSLPSSLDTSDGFYRRWFIIDFPNQFPEGKDIINTIPDEEYNNLARKCALLLPKIIEEGKITNQGSIEERRKAYILASNPLPLFIKTYCEKGSGYYVESNELYNAYVQYLISKKKRKVSRKEFNEALSEEGLYPVRTTKDYKNGYYVECVKLIEGWKVLIFS